MDQLNYFNGLMEKETAKNQSKPPVNFKDLLDSFTGRLLFYAMIYIAVGLPAAFLSKLMKPRVSIDNNEIFTSIMILTMVGFLLFEAYLFLKKSDSLAGLLFKKKLLELKVKGIEAKKQIAELEEKLKEIESGK